jgi:hypothetical protein
MAVERTKDEPDFFYIVRLSQLCPKSGKRELKWIPSFFLVGAARRGTLGLGVGPMDLGLSAF